MLIVEFDEYRWGVTGTHWYRRAFVTYSGSCLWAYDVTYHKWQKTIEAWGDVRLRDGTGKQEHFDAVLLKIDHGTLTPIKLLTGKERSVF